MSKAYLPYEPDQQLLLPAALQEWLPDDHLAYFISDVVDQLDISEITARYDRTAGGSCCCARTGGARPTSAAPDALGPWRSARRLPTSAVPGRRRRLAEVGQGRPLEGGCGG